MQQKTIGTRIASPILGQPSAEYLAAGAAFCEELTALGGASTFIPKGVYRFRSLAEAEAQRVDALARGLAARAAARRGDRK